MPLPAVVAGAPMACSFGEAPSALIVEPQGRMLIGGLPVATVTDVAPNVNVPPFGLCTSLANPEVAAATAVVGVLTPMPCIPVIPEPWLPGSLTMLMAGQPVLSLESRCLCAWGGVISVLEPGQLIVEA